MNIEQPLAKAKIWSSSTAKYDQVCIASLLVAGCVTSGLMLLLDQLNLYL